MTRRPPSDSSPEDLFALLRQLVAAGGIGRARRLAGAVLVTRNERDFSRVPGLVTEDWSIARGS